jgi:hypothetical protein
MAALGWKRTSCYPAQAGAQGVGDQVSRRDTLGPACAGERHFLVASGPLTYSRTSIFPILAPENSPRKASGAEAIPS